VKRQRILIPILIVIVIIILIISYGILFKSSKGSGGNNQTGVTAESSITKAVVTPRLEADHDDSLLEELNQAPKAEYQYTLSSGEEISIFIPQGVDPPSQEVVEKLYRKKR